VTSNQSSPRTVVEARATAEVMASSMEVVEVPTTSLMPYVCAIVLPFRLRGAGAAPSPAMVLAPAGLGHPPGGARPPPGTRPGTAYCPG